MTSLIIFILVCIVARKCLKAPAKGWPENNQDW
jgi:hypothetical protein